MKVRVQFKDPDAFYEGIRDAVRSELSTVEGLSDYEREELREGRSEKVGIVLEKWVEDGEYVTIEFDTDTQTATVLERK